MIDYAATVWALPGISVSVYEINNDGSVGAPFRQLPGQPTLDPNHHTVKRLISRHNVQFGICVNIERDQLPINNILIGDALSIHLSLDGFYIGVSDIDTRKLVRDRSCHTMASSLVVNAATGAVRTFTFSESVVPADNRPNIQQYRLIRVGVCHGRGSWVNHNQAYVAGTPPMPDGTIVAPYPGEPTAHGIECQHATVPDVEAMPGFIPSANTTPICWFDFYYGSLQTHQFWQRYWYYHPLVDPPTAYPVPPPGGAYTLLPAPGFNAASNQPGAAAITAGPGSNTAAPTTTLDQPRHLAPVDGHQVHPQAPLPGAHPGDPIFVGDDQSYTQEQRTGPGFGAAGPAQEPAGIDHLRPYSVYGTNANANQPGAPRANVGPGRRPHLAGSGFNQPLPVIAEGSRRSARRSRTSTSDPVHDANRPAVTQGFNLGAATNESSANVNSIDSTAREGLTGFVAPGMSSTNGANAASDTATHREFGSVAVPAIAGATSNGSPVLVNSAAGPVPRIDSSGAGGTAVTEAATSGISANEESAVADQVSLNHSTPVAANAVSNTLVFATSSVAFVSGGGDTNDMQVPVNGAADVGSDSNDEPPRKRFKTSKKSHRDAPGGDGGDKNA